MAKILINHGHHGSKPKHEDDVWTIFYVCSNCNKHVSDDEICPHCGEILENSEEIKEFRKISYD